MSLTIIGDRNPGRRSLAAPTFPTTSLHMDHTRPVPVPYTSQLPLHHNRSRFLSGPQTRPPSGPRGMLLGHAVHSSPRAHVEAHYAHTPKNCRWTAIHPADACAHPKQVASEPTLPTERSVEQSDAGLNCSSSRPLHRGAMGGEREHLSDPGVG